jgi:IS30 family transposase
MMVRSALTAQEKTEIWRGYGAGESLRSISRTLGRSMGTLRMLVASTGGRQPVVPRRSALRLSLAEREEISRGVVAGDSCRLIAGRLRRAPSTVSREITSNDGRNRYRACRAEQAAWDRARRPKAAKLVSCSQLRQMVEAKLASRWSPQQIAGWLARTYPDDRELQVSHETIYMSAVRAAAGRIAEGTDTLPALAPDGPPTARGAGGQWARATAEHGPYQRTSR